VMLNIGAANCRSRPTYTKTVLKIMRGASQGPVGYEQVAHILIPRRYTQQIYRYDAIDKPERWADECTHEQDIDGLSKLFSEANIDHYLAKEVLEIKRF